MNYIIDPPVAVFSIFILFMLIFLRKYLRRDYFYVLIISTILSFLLAEGVCRFINVGNPETAVWKAERVIGEKYAYRPNTGLLFRYPDNPRGYFNEENEVLGTINSKGFRGLDKEFEKSNDKIRIAFLGDSFTLGIGVKDDDTLPASFEHAIQQKYSNIEVLNFGLEGSSTQRQIRLLEEYAIKFNPDIVVVVLFLNDANRVGTIIFLSKPEIFKQIRKYSFFINALFGVIEKSILHRKMIHHYQDGYIEGNPGWEAVKTALRKGKLLSEEYDFKFIVAVYPVLIHLDEKYPFTDIHKTIENFCISINIQFVDLLNAFLGKKDSELWVHSTDQHPNEVAHKYAAAELTKYFVSQDSIKRILSNP